MSTKRFCGFFTAFWMLACVCTVFCGCRGVEKKQDSVYQVSTIPALIRGDYEGPWSCGQLKQKGDLGLGTFNGLDGELVMFDGDVYQGRMDGGCSKMPDSVLVPFAAVTFFEPNQMFELVDIKDYDTLKAELEKRLPSANLPYAFRIHANFKSVSYRSVPLQQRPYKPLTQVVKDQHVSRHENERGTLVGFWLPAYFAGVNVSGFHLHYISGDRKSAGHLLGLEADRLSVAVDQCHGLELDLPRQGDFLKGSLTVPDPGNVHRVEKLHDS